jgi:hypothetical protein
MKAVDLYYGPADFGQSYRPDFFGGALSLREAIQQASHGWPEGMRLVQEISLPLVEHLIALVAPSGAWGWDVTGANWDMGEYLSGSPECWLTPSLEATKPTIDILLDAFTSGGIPPEAIKLRGAAMVALTLALQQAGYMVRVSLAQGSESTATPGRTVWARVVLTDDNGGPLDTDRLLFMLAHPAAKRWLMWAYASHTMGQTKQEYQVEGYNPINSAPPWQADLVIPRMLYSQGGADQWSNLARIEAWVKKTFLSLTSAEVQTP